MPVLMCPNCHAGMKEVNREGVALDMCPECHGIWLDRGELPKLLEAAQRDVATAAPGVYPSPTPPAPQPGWHRQHDDSDDPYKARGGMHRGYHKKSKLERIFDLFD